MFECKTIIHERDHLIFPTKDGAGYPSSRPLDLFVVLAPDALKFYTTSTKETEAFSLNPIRMNADNDKNSQYISLIPLLTVS